MARTPRRIAMTPARIAALRKAPQAHKYDHGHALMLSGGPGHTGAARLAARGALRVGAGLVTLGVPPAAQQEVAAQITAIMLTRIDGAAALTEALRDARLTALCLGPGLGVARAAELLPPALGAGRPTVLDADALTALAQDGELFGLLHADCVLTPHEGEFARLFPDLTGDPEDTCTAAQRAGCTVLRKGVETIVATPDGGWAIHSASGYAAVPWLATAGTGDVLAGLIGGLLARGLPPAAAARDATWLHAACARHVGPGLIAEDLPDALPAVFADLGL